MRRHLAKALDHGAKPREILEFLETTAINAGIPVIWRGSQALAEELKKRNQPFE
jgi:alkylhydroperoxidase/carboxymuconolactone decarboxylase family protein YurZ